MIKIAFTCNWGESSKQLLARYSRQTPNNTGRWGSLIGVEEPTKADFCIVMDGGFPKGVPPEQCIFLQREPPNIKNVTHNYPNIFYQGTYDRLYQAAIYWINLPFNTLDQAQYPSKNKKASCILSGKTKCAGHRQRLEIAKQLVNCSSIDFYGRNLDKYLGSKTKGILTEKWHGLEQYRYSFVFENTQLHNYFTEKICDCFLMLTKPIYWGCPNILEYFPRDSYALLDPNNLQESLEKVDIPITRIEQEALLEAKRLVLHKYNLWATLQKIIDGEIQ